MLAFVFDGKASSEDLLFMADQIGHNLSIDSIHKPDHVILASRHENRSLVMPLDEVEVFLGNLIKSPLQFEAILDIPNPQDIIHATCHQPFATGVELAKLYGLCVAR